MSCTLATLAACFSWSGLYVDAGISYQDARIERTVIERTVTQWKAPGFTTIDKDETVSHTEAAANPYGRLALGYSVDFDVNRGRLTISAECFHDSSLADSRDHGINGCGVSGRWRPFGGAR